MHHRRRESYCECNVHGEGNGNRRRFFTKAEKVGKLKNCAEELKKELKTLEEKTKEMQRYGSLDGVRLCP